MNNEKKLHLGKGVNLGGWLNHNFRNNDHLESFIKQSDVIRIADWGFDNIRLPFDYTLIVDEQTGEALEQGFKWIDKALSWAEESSLKVVLDMHRLPGYSFMDGAEKPGAIPPLFTDPLIEEFFIEIWRKLTKRYLGKHKHLVFEIANEIAAPTGAVWNELAAKVVREIRKIDKTRLIVIGSNCWNVCSTYTEMKVINDPNIIYNFHFYNPFPFTHQKASWSPEMVYYNKLINYPGKSEGLLATANRAEKENRLPTAESLRNLATFFESRFSDKGHLKELMDPSIKFAKEHQISLYCSEFGVIQNAPVEDSLRWFKDTLEIFDEYNISWSVWSYKDNNFPLVDCNGNVCTTELLELLKKNLRIKQNK
jgi:aryl-phospho-beta-D-glucosidase BglC (GH1 family)